MEIAEQLGLAEVAGSAYSARQAVEGTKTNVVVRIFGLGFADALEAELDALADRLGQIENDLSALSLRSPGVPAEAAVHRLAHRGAEMPAAQEAQRQLTAIQGCGA